MDERTRAILASDFNQAEKVVWMTIDAMADEDGWCDAPQRDIADAMNTSASYVNRTLNKMESRGWIERGESGIRCLTGNKERCPRGNVAQQATEGVASQATSVAHEATDVAQQATGVAKQATERCPDGNAEDEGKSPLTPSSPSPTPSPSTPPLSPSSPESTDGSEGNGRSQREGGSAREEAALREDDPPEIEVFVSEVGRRPQPPYETDRITQTVGQTDAELEVWARQCRRARDNVGGDPHRVRLGYLLEDYEQAIDRITDSDGNIQPDKAQRSHAQPSPAATRGGQWGDYG